MTFQAASSTYLAQRQQMVDSQLQGRGIRDDRVLDAMLRVPRHEFAPERYRYQAYEDHPLPIAEGQTISQPYIVALMLEALSLLPTDRVLEVGTGSGYVTALLAELAGEVVSIERHGILADSARAAISNMGYGNVTIVTGDGTRGYPARAPYNAIIVSAAAAEIPKALMNQLAEAGRMIIPVGAQDAQQLLFVHIQDGQPRTSVRELCRFVPLVSGS